MGHPWPGGARLALTVVVDPEEGDGDDESDRAYGINEGAPRVLGLLARHEVPATFVATAGSLERAPQLAAGIVASDHEVCAQGHRGMPVPGMPEHDERASIRKAAESMAATTGTRPVGWLSRGPCSPATRRLIVEEGFGYHMGDRSRDEPSIDRTLAGPIVVLPFAPDSDDLGMCQAPWLTSRDWLAYACDSFDRLLDESHSRPRMMSLGVHLRIIGRPGRIGALEKFLQHARAARGVWWARSRDIAAHWARVAAAD